MCFQASKGPSTVTDKPVDEADISETGRLFLRNLPYSASEEDIRELFEPYGELTDCHLVLDRYDAQHHAAQPDRLLLSLSSCCSVVLSDAFIDLCPLPPLVGCCRERRTSKGLAYVTYLMPEDAVRAASELDANDFQVRLSASLCPPPSPPGPLLLLLMPFLDIMSLFLLLFSSAFLLLLLYLLHLLLLLFLLLLLLLYLVLLLLLLLIYLLLLLILLLLLFLLDVVVVVFILLLPHVLLPALLLPPLVSAAETAAPSFFSAQGRLLHILPARLPPHSKTTAAPAEDSTNFKAKKEADLKSQAGNRCGSSLRPPPPPLHPFDLQSHQ